jgi:hypothetical protein
MAANFRDCAKSSAFQVAENKQSIPTLEWLEIDLVAQKAGAHFLI